MAVKIRLSRVGKKHEPFYRLIAVDSRQKRDGACIEALGTYDGLKGEVIQFHPERYESWIEKGAVPSLSAQKIYRLYKKSGMESKVVNNQ